MVRASRHSAAPLEGGAPAAAPLPATGRPQAAHNLPSWNEAEAAASSRIWGSAPLPLLMMPPAPPPPLLPAPPAAPPVPPPLLPSRRAGRVCEQEHPPHHCSKTDALDLDNWHTLFLPRIGPVRVGHRCTRPQHRPTRPLAPRPVWQVRQCSAAEPTCSSLVWLVGLSNARPGGLAARFPPVGMGAPLAWSLAAAS